MRLAFIVLAHQHPEQLGRLIRRLATPSAHVFLHVDRQCPLAIHQAMQRELRGQPAVTWLRRHYSRWASFGLVRAALAGIEAAVQGQYDYALLLSGQDYPLRPVAALERFLGEQAGASFIQVRPLPDADWPPEGAVRLLRWYFRFDWPANWLTRKVEGGLGRLANALRPRRSFPAGVSPRGGSQ